MTSLQTRFEKEPAVVFRKIADEFFLFQNREVVPETSLSLYTFEEVGARIWGLLDGKRTVSELIETLSEEFRVEPAKAKEDLLEFLGQLKREGLIRHG